MNQLKRNELGLLEGIDYKFNEDGSINWRAMIPSKYLFINYEYKEKLEMQYAKSLKEINVADLEDKYLLILLGGIKHVLRLRGFSSVKQKVNYVDHHKCVNTCTIKLLPNFETNGEVVTFSDTASASIDSTSGVFRLFIESIAANRAFVRCVRNALGINIVAKDEFDDKANKAYLKISPDLPETSPTGFGPHKLLEDLCRKLDKDGSHSFEKIRERTVQFITIDNIKMESDPLKWTGFSSIPNPDAYTLMTKINEAIKSKKKS